MSRCRSNWRKRRAPRSTAASARRERLDSEAEVAAYIAQLSAELSTMAQAAHFDLVAYDRYLSGKLEDFEFDTGKVTEALRALPGVAGPG